MPTREGFRLGSEKSQQFFYLSQGGWTNIMLDFFGIFEYILEAQKKQEFFHCPMPLKEIGAPLSSFVGKADNPVLFIVEPIVIRQFLYDV